MGNPFTPVRERDKKVQVRIGENELTLTNLDKKFWPEGWTKGDLIDYYVKISPYILPYLRNRPFVMNRFPDGILGHNFYHKDCPSYAPEWIKTLPVPSEGSAKKIINYVICNNMETLAWLASQGCIETHFWLARMNNLNNPDIAVFDLDPAEPATFEDALEVGLLVQKALEQLGLRGYPKTSGATGLHVYVPLVPENDYSEVRKAVEFISLLIHRAHPSKTTMERVIANRTGKVYLDYLQNAVGRTMAGPYSLRPEPGAPVSTPLSWDEVASGKIKPADFNISTIHRRLQERGDLWSGFFDFRQQLHEVLDLMARA